MRPCFAHARGGDDHERPVQIVQLLRFGGLADVLQPLEAERILAVVQILARLRVEALGMIAMHLGHVDRQRAVDEERDIRDPLLVDKLVQQQHQLLRAPHGERRHDDPAAAPARCG